MSNRWDINVTTCADCPMRAGDHCEAARWMPYLDDRRGLDLSASLAGAPPPDRCPLEGGEMRIEIHLAASSRRCGTCKRPLRECPGELEYARRVASGDWDGWRGALAICRDAVEVQP